jgi:hypothetical protein
LRCRPYYKWNFGLRRFMGVLLDKAVNLSSMYGASYATFVPAVTSGLQVYSLLGGTQALTLLNSAPSGGVGPNTIGAGVPVIQSPSGVQVGTSTLGRLNTAYTDVGGSMTVMIVAQTPTTSVNALGSMCSSETTNASSLFSIRFDPFAGGAFNPIFLTCGYLNGSGVATSSNVNGAPSSTSAVVTQTALPNFYVAKADFTNLKLSIACLTAPTIIPGGSLTLAVGSTRPSVGNPLAIGTGSSVELGALSISHAIVIFNRVTTVAEDQLMYAQMKALMATRGITI